MARSLQNIRKKRHVARALDGVREQALLLVGDRRDPARNDLAALRDEALQKLDVLVVDFWRIGAGERTRLFAPEEGTPLPTAFAAAAIASAAFATFAAA